MPVRLTGSLARALMVSVLAPACLALVGPVPAVLADAAAGSAAFEKGDYVRAMAEWTSAAERGDPDAEFGLGMLYERGDGELKQNYKQAAHWYEKAAEHDHVGAQYRLALIWSAGSDDFPADLVEAYRWIVLASERGLPTEVKVQLERVIDRRQIAEAQKRAATWKEAHAAKKAEPAPAPATAPAPGPVGTVAIPPPRAGTAGSTTASSGKAAGCPGWPFPTLPCTEQFPALPGAAATRPPSTPPPRAPAPN